jgi:hypothetical protein
MIGFIRALTPVLVVGDFGRPNHRLQDYKVTAPGIRSERLMVASSAS